MPKVFKLWPNGKLTCPECGMKITIEPVSYRENHCPGCGELFAVVPEDDELFRECWEDCDP